MKISLIITTYNEAKHIGQLLDSLLKQTRQPDELVVVDAGSADETRDIIQGYKSQFDFPLKLINQKLKRSEARNLAITKAKHQVIAVTDAGNILDKNWLELLTQPLIDSKAESVAGFYLSLTPTHFSQALAPFVSVMPRNLDEESYLPSSRSVAFTKEAWQKAGKYPEHLEYCEDLIFAKNLKTRTNMVVEKKAIVYWIQHETFTQFFKQISNYARGDVVAFYKPHVFKILTVFGRYAVFALIHPLFLIYLGWSLLKINPYLTDKKALIYVPALQITADLAVMYGAILGLRDIHGYNQLESKDE